MKRMNLTRSDKAKLNIVSTLANQFVTMACGIVVPHLLITAYGSAAYGITVSITQFLSYIALLESGIGGVARAQLYEPLAKGDAYQTSAVYYAVLRFFRYVAAVFVVYNVGLGFVFYDIAHVEMFSRVYIFMLVIVIGLSTLAKYMGGLANLILIMADQRQYINNIILAATTIINTLLVVVLAGVGADLIWVKLVSSLIFVVRPVLYVIYVLKHYRLPSAAKNSATLEQKWTGIGQHIAYFLHTNIDVVLLTMFADVRLVSVYSVYYLVVSSISSVTQAFGGGMEAALGEMVAKHETENLRAAVRKYSRLLSSASFVLFGCTGVLIVSFVQLYTRGVTDADYVQPLFAVVLAVGEALNCLALPYSCLAVSANKIKETRWGAYGEAIVNIVISLALVRWNPLLGVALGTLAATLFHALFYMYYAARNILEIPAARLMLRFFAVAVGLIAVAFIGQFALSFFSITSYLLWVLAGAATFIVLALPILANYKLRGGSH